MKIRPIYVVGSLVVVGVVWWKWDTIKAWMPGGSMGGMAQTPAPASSASATQTPSPSAASAGLSSLAGNPELQYKLELEREQTKRAAQQQATGVEVAKAATGIVNEFLKFGRDQA